MDRCDVELLDLAYQRRQQLLCGGVQQVVMHYCYPQVELRCTCSDGSAAVELLRHESCR